MLLKIHPNFINPQRIQSAVDCLNEGGVIAFPTDTVYAFGCDLYQPKAIEQLIVLSGKKRPDFSFICYDISQATEFIMSLDTNVFKEMKRVFPGKYTFILNASAQVSRLFQTNKKTVGIRIPDNNVAREIVRVLGHPMLSTSLHSEDTIIDYMTDPQDIDTEFHRQIQMVIDGGPGGTEPSTVIDFTSGEPELIREGAGEW